MLPQDVTSPAYKLVSVMLMSYDSAQQANESCGSNTNGLCLSFKFTRRFAEAGVWCWNTITAILMRALCVFPPCGGPSRVLSELVPSDTLDRRDNLHLSSWLSGLYCFRRSVAFTSSSSAQPGKPIFVFVCWPMWFVTRWHSVLAR